MQVRLRLAFNHRKTGFFRVRASSMDVEFSDGYNEPVVLEYARSDAFLDQLKAAAITDSARSRIATAITTSAKNPGTPFFCEDIDLSDRQVLFLLAGAAAPGLGDQVLEYVDMVVHAQR